VFDGAPSKLNTATLTEIYGEEDWTEMHDEEEAAAAHAAKAHDLEPSREERMAGLA
jgi:phosphonate transport system ATP-binding protein